MFEWTVGFKNTVLKSSHGFSEVSIPVRATIGWRTEWTGDLFPAPGPETLRHIPVLYFSYGQPKYCYEKTIHIVLNQLCSSLWASRF